MGLNITNDNFDKEVMNSDIPVLVDFWAPWCAPCKMIAPVVEELAEEYHGKVKVCKVNVDEGRDIVSNYGVVSIPTLALFHKGEVKAKKVGVFPKGEIVQMINSLNWS
ncbi:MAG: thioredoxin [Candidatus Aadella gelida]|nr:thioredoxin [Candidatus Aadella gelida]